MADIFYNMDSEKILFCYRDDKLKKPFVYEAADEMKIVAAVPCDRSFLGKTFPISRKQIKKNIAAIYESSGAGYLWLDDSLCDFLQMDKMDLPEILYEKWLSEVPFFHTLVFADDKVGRAIEHIHAKTDKLAAVCVVCYEKNISEYEELAAKLFQKEGIVLQIFTYEVLEEKRELLVRDLIIKGRVAVLDFDDRRSFWDKRLKKDMGYYSFWNEIRLFLDTFQKNGYNTLTK